MTRSEDFTVKGHVAQGHAFLDKAREKSTPAESAAWSGLATAHFAAAQAELALIEDQNARRRGDRR